MIIPLVGIYDKSLINDKYFRIIIRKNFANTRDILHKNHEVFYIILTPRDRRCRPKMASLAPARGLTREKVRGLICAYVTTL
jgi:hypothetical protein